MIQKLFPGQEFKAYLFDFDGTVADTMPGHYEAWNHALKSYDVTYTKEQHQAWAGKPIQDIVRLLSELHGVDLPVEDIIKVKEIHYSKSVHLTKVIVPVFEIIQAAHGKIPMAIVSGSHRPAVSSTLKLLKMDHYFDLLVCAEDYKNGKPAPDCFLKAAQFFQVEPKDCLVFEDGMLGIQSAMAAGMPYLKIEAHPESGHRIVRS
jgi:beta-phosphoglucomutase-like phosphatase (HAD superfamily)